MSRILIADDDFIMRFLIRETLAIDPSLSFIEAEDGTQAVEFARREAPDLIILDVMMPAMDGLEVCQELKKTIPSIPIILLTARDDMATRAAAMDLGVSEFVAKPVNNRDLLDRVRVQLRNLEWDKTADQAFWRIEKSTRGAGPKKP